MSFKTWATATRNTHFVDIFLLDGCVLENLLDRLHRLSEEVHVQFFKLCARKGLGKVVAVLEAFDLTPMLCWLLRARFAFSPSRFSLAVRMQQRWRAKEIFHCGIEEL